MTDCIFCGIAEKRMPASTVYEDEDIIAFMDISPVAEGHTLVIPKRHSELVHQMDARVAGKLMEAAKIIAQAIRKSGIQCDGINFMVSDGEAAGQEVRHVHMHLIPRYMGDGLGRAFQNKPVSRPTIENIEAAANRIRRSLK